MNPREADFYRWFETFTLSHDAPADDPHLALALSRRYVEGPADEWVVTQAGWDWFAGRCATIIARCNAGHHDYRAKTPFCNAVHCQWCGHCEVRPCEECRRVYLGGTVEGGWANPLDATYDSHPRSTITHGYADQ